MITWPGHEATREGPRPGTGAATSWHRAVTARPGARQGVGSPALVAYRRGPIETALLISDHVCENSRVARHPGNDRVSLYTTGRC
jgi:hypothetical protein